MYIAMLNGWTVPLNKEVGRRTTVLTAALILSYVTKYGHVSGRTGITQQDKSTGSPCAGQAGQQDNLKPSALGSAVTTNVEETGHMSRTRENTKEREREMSDTEPGSKWVLKRH